MAQRWTQVWDVTSKEDAEGQQFCPGNTREETEEPLGSELGQRSERAGGFSEEE